MAASVHGKLPSGQPFNVHPFQLHLSMFNAGKGRGSHLERGGGKLMGGVGLVPGGLEG